MLFLHYLTDLVTLGRRLTYIGAIKTDKKGGTYSVTALSSCEKMTLMIDPPPAPEKQEVGLREVLSANIYIQHFMALLQL